MGRWDLDDFPLQLSAAVGDCRDDQCYIHLTLRNRGKHAIEVAGGPGCVGFLACRDGRETEVTIAGVPASAGMSLMLDPNEVSPYDTVILRPMLPGRYDIVGLVQCLVDMVRRPPGALSWGEMGGLPPDHPCLQDSECFCHDRQLQWVPLPIPRFSFTVPGPAEE
jgi:hypothetical protein